MVYFDKIIIGMTFEDAQNYVGKYKIEMRDIVLRVVKRDGMYVLKTDDIRHYRLNVNVLHGLVVKVKGFY